MNSEACLQNHSEIQNPDPEIIEMLNSVDFTHSSSSSSTTTPRRRNRRKQSNDSLDSQASTPTTNSAAYQSIAKAKQKVQLKKKQRLEKYIQENEDKLIKKAQDLRDFAKSECGLISDEIRSKVWPVLAETINDQDESMSSTDESSSSCSDSDFETAMSSLSVSDDGQSSDRLSESSSSIEDLKSHPEWNQVEMDVHRTLARFPPGTSEDERVTLQTDLTPLIVRVLKQNKRFRYYQGFHDICLTLILVLGSENAYRVAKILAHRTIFKRYLTKSLEETAMQDLQLMYVLLFKHNHKLEEYLREAELGTLFALSWPLTWLSHVLDDYQQVVTCFDLFLSTHPLMPIYISAAVILQRAKEIYSTEKDMPMLHALLSHIPDTVDIPTVIEVALKLFAEYPPRMVKTKYLQEYEKECEESMKRHARVPPADTLSRYSISKWVVAGTMSAAAFYLLWTKSYLELVR